MERVYLRKNKGITLIALVITIIVLLILAGVAIAMLSGENGILKKAAEAKTRTEESQNDESTTLLGYELTINNATNTNVAYRYQQGYITGIEYDTQSDESKKSVQELEDKLPEGYNIKYKYNPTTDKDEEITDKTQKITTGMAVVKENKIVARIVIFGDVDCNGKIDDWDSLEINKYYDFMDSCMNRDFQKIAGNIKNDNELNEDDYMPILQYVGWEIDEINQNINIEVSAKNIKRRYKALQEYINSLDKDTGYSFTYNSEEDTYKLKGTKDGTKVEELVSILPDASKVKIVDKDGKEITNGTNIKNGDYVQYDGANFAYIEVN